MNCAICLETVGTILYAPFTECQHKHYHSKCIEVWRKVNDSCPICREKYLINTNQKQDFKDVFDTWTHKEISDVFFSSEDFDKEELNKIVKELKSL